MDKLLIADTLRTTFALSPSLARALVLPIQQIVEDADTQGMSAEELRRQLKELARQAGAGVLGSEVVAGIERGRLRAEWVAMSADRRRAVDRYASKLCIALLQGRRATPGMTN